jgi:hypothetical protein
MMMNIKVGMGQMMPNKLLTRVQLQLEKIHNQIGQHWL